MTYKIVALPGDGIGPEILNGSLELLEWKFRAIRNNK